MTILPARSTSSQARSQPNRGQSGRSRLRPAAKACSMSRTRPSALPSGRCCSRRPCGGSSGSPTTARTTTRFSTRWRPGSARVPCAPRVDLRPRPGKSRGNRRVLRRPADGLRPAAGLLPLKRVQADGAASPPGDRLREHGTLPRGRAHRGKPEGRSRCRLGLREQSPSCCRPVSPGAPGWRKLGGYVGGMEAKAALLKLERAAW